MLQRLRSPCEDEFFDIVGSARRSLLLVSPFIKCTQSNKLISRLTNVGVEESIQVSIMTDLRADCILSGSLDVEALIAFAKFTPNFNLTYLPNLHAKVYIADDHAAIITSANFTDGGLRKNFEYGVVCKDSTMIARVREDIAAYASLARFASSDGNSARDA